MSSALEYLSLQSFGLAWMTHMLVGMVWYAGPVFGDLCGHFAFNKAKHRTADLSRAMTATMLGAAMAMLVFIVILNAARCKSAVEGALWGLGLGFFFNAGLNAPHPFFEDRPFELFAIHRGCHAASLTISGALLGQLCGGSYQQ